MSQFSTIIGKLSIDANNEAAIGDVFVAKPKDELQEKLGTIVGIIEMFDQPDEFMDKFFDIISDLETEYYLPPFENEGGNEKRFEECLQRANRRIAKAISDSISVIEPKNINALIALNNKNKLYISKIGKNHAFLFHRKKQHDYTIIDIFTAAGEKRSKITPEKMFSNIINGSMTEKDNILFCTDNVLENLSQNELMEITTESTPASALKEIKKLLESDQPDSNSYAVAINPIVIDDEDEEEEIIRTTTKKISSTEGRTPHKVETQSSINRLITTQEDTEKFLAPSMAPNWKKTLMIILSGFNKGSLLALKYAKILANQIIKQSQELIKIVSTKINNRGKSPQPETNTEPEVDMPAHAGVEKKTHKVEAREEKTEAPSAHMPNLPEDGGPSQTISNWLNNQIAKFISLNKLQRALLIIAFILVFFFSQSMVWQGRANSVSDTLSAGDKILQIEEHLNTAEAQNIFNDEDGAKASLVLATDLIEEIPNSRKYKTEKEELLGRISNLEKALQKIEYINEPQVASDLSNQNPAANIRFVSKFENTIFAIDVQNQSVYKVDLVGKQTTAGKLTSNFDEAKKIQALDEDTVIILNNDNQIYEYKFSTNEITSVLSSDDGIIDFDLYGGKLYSLRNNQIFKHFPTASGYNAGSAWLADNSDFTNPIAMTIDGGIYTVDNNNKIKYFLAGKSETVNFNEINPPLSSPAQIFSNIESSYLYILDQANQRIVVLDKNNGNLKIQYTSGEFSDLKSMVVQETEKKIYILSNQKIYLIDITF
jgi:hypothetical protein